MIGDLQRKISATKERASALELADSGSTIEASATSPQEQFNRVNEGLATYAIPSTVEWGPTHLRDDRQPPKGLTYSA